MKKPLKQIVEIRAGHPFRGAIKESTNGNGYVIQIRDQNEDGQIAWAQLIQAEVIGRKAPEWLMPGDILFSARGIRNISSVVHAHEIGELNLPVVCSPHYFQIRVNHGTDILPEFLAWQLNQTIAQRYFQQSAEGSVQVSIRRSVLEQTLITVPSLVKQQQIIKLAECASREKQIYRKLIELRNAELDEIARQIFKD
ncbi:restriction endonuclease subunit S [Vibrio quintilis]|uniref:Type I restriction modification DNA specificity domain protein n=1 Tax=Vibrio quintilis TaxID=1117707 RepID=A0A1M7YWU0_9VIBR|nr:restriction endonuclease subunit S [Vibrio quintilis]SHO57052.1 Type I restriction modification DNA specificity domain protein [Vibrio quintilis]